MCARTAGQVLTRFSFSPLHLPTTLAAGDAVTVVALGGSVTHGSGASDPSRAYPGQFFAWLNATFPRPPGAAPHAFHNAGLGGTTSALFAMCSARLVPQVRPGVAGGALCDSVPSSNAGASSCARLQGRERERGGNLQLH